MREVKYKKKPNKLHCCNLLALRLASGSKVMLQVINHFYLNHLLYLLQYSLWMYSCIQGKIREGFSQPYLVVF